MTTVVPIAQINDLLAKRAFGQAIPLAEAATKAAPRNAAAWFALARGTFGLGRCATADLAIDKAMKLGANDFLTNPLNRMRFAACWRRSCATGALSIAAWDRGRAAAVRF